MTLTCNRLCIKSILSQIILRIVCYVARLAGPSLLQLISVSNSNPHPCVERMQWQDFHLVALRLQGWFAGAASYRDMPQRKDGVQLSNFTSRSRQNKSSLEACASPVCRQALTCLVCVCSLQLLVVRVPDEIAWSFRYLSKGADIQKYAACLHLTSTSPYAVLVDDLSSFLQSRYTGQC